MSRTRTPEELEILRGMINMRLNGHTLQQIGDHFGVLKQCVQQKLASFCGTTDKRKNRKSDLEALCIYPNLFDWLIENRIKLYELSDICGIQSKNTMSIRKKLIGERNFKISEIRKLLQYSGKTFEFLFFTKEPEADEPLSPPTKGP